MKLLLDTSTPFCTLILVDVKGVRHDHSWQANRELATLLLGKIESALQSHSKTWDDVTGIGFYRGPGSFTGLRIGATIVNTLAYEKATPLVGVTGDRWVEDALQQLANGVDGRIVLPLYDRPANVTQPRK